MWGELHSQGIDVLTLCPGATESEATEKLPPSQLENLQPAREVARLALDNIQNGPTYVPNPHYKALFDRLTGLPRREALAGMAESMKAHAG